MTTSFTVLFNAASGNQQGLATDGHHTWISYDIGNGMAQIKTYTWDGTYIGTSAPLALGHAAELDYRTANDRLYVANGGLETGLTSDKVKVFEVSLNSNRIASAITKTYDFGFLGYNGLVATDDVSDRIYVMGGPDAGPWQLVKHNFATGGTSNPVTITDPNILLQGVSIVRGAMWLYVSDQATTDLANARIDTFDPVAGGSPKSFNPLSFTGEAEGIALNPLTGSVYIGAHSVNRVMRVSGVV